MKGFGVFMVGLLAAVGGIAAATYITKKKLEKENEEDYYSDWDDLDDDIWKSQHCFISALQFTEDFHGSMVCLDNLPNQQYTQAVP